MTMTFPALEKALLTFLAWGVSRKLAGSTIELYLSGIKKIHTVLGLPCIELRPDLIKSVIKGLKKQEFMTKKIKRVPMTRSTMLLLKRQLFNSDMETIDALCFGAYVRLPSLDLSVWERSSAGSLHPLTVISHCSDRT